MKKALCFHVADCVGQKLKVQVQNVPSFTRWARGAKATPETVAQTARLLPMPGEQHVFLAQLAGVADERELQRVLVRPGEGVNAGAVTALWIYATGSLDRGGVAGDGDCAPPVAFAVAVKIDIERAIGPAGPDGAERVGTGVVEGSFSRARISGACARR